VRGRHRTALLVVLTLGLGGGALALVQPGLADPGNGHGNPQHGNEGNEGNGNQGRGNQGHGNQGHGNQGHGNQGHGKQGHGKQGHGKQGHDVPVTVLASGLAGGSGSVLGPGGDLYVTEPLGHQISRIDLRTGDRTVVVDCLPAPVGSGSPGAMDLAFLRGSMYVLTVAGPDADGEGLTGIYRVEDGECEVVADIGHWAVENPPPSDIDVSVANGVPYAMQPYRDGFLVTDQHHDRILEVTLDGGVHEVLQLGEVAPTGLERLGHRMWVSTAGPVTLSPEDGQLISFEVDSPEPRVEASGGHLLVDVQARGNTVYALAQGVSTEGAEAGSPARPETGSLLRVDGTGFDVVAEGLDRPTSMEIRGHTAYVVTLDGEVWEIGLGHSGGHD
jgi:hypothetical protein